MIHSLLPIESTELYCSSTCYATCIPYLCDLFCNWPLPNRFLSFSFMLRLAIVNRRVSRRRQAEQYMIQHLITKRRFETGGSKWESGWWSESLVGGTSLGQGQGRCSVTLLYSCKLGYLKDSNAAAHYVDSDIFYEVIHLPASFKTYITLYYNFFTGTH